MARWLVQHYDGNDVHHTIVEDRGPRLPFGAHAALEELLGGGGPDFEVNAIVELPDGFTPLVVAGDEEAAVDVLEMKA